MDSNGITCIIFLGILFLMFVPPLLTARGTWVPLAHRLVRGKDPLKAETILLRMTTFGLLRKTQVDPLLEQYGPERGDPDPGPAPLTEGYVPPALSAEKLETLKASGMGLAAVQPYAARAVRCVKLCTENAALLAEVNDLRARLQIDPRPEFTNDPHR